MKKTAREDKKVGLSSRLRLLPVKSLQCIYLRVSYVYNIPYS